MGFFGGLSKTLFGGSDSKSQQTSSSESGFSLLPKDIQDAYTGYAQNVSSYLPESTRAGMFTPLQRTADENNAYSAIRGGFAPTASSISSDIAMQTNPYNDFVINDINRQATGDYSILKSALNNAGQSGSNRGMLSANDIDLTRLNQIGTFRQGQYDNALQNALTTLPNARAGDAQNLLGIGNADRALDAETKQAPLSSLAAIAQILGILPSSGGSTSTGQGTSSGSSQNGIFKQIGL